MPLKKMNVVVEAMVPVPPSQPPEVEPPDQVMPPIYLPVPTPPDLGIWGPNDPRPTPPIFIPVPNPPGIWGGRPPEYVDIGGPGDQPVVDHELPGDQPGISGPGGPWVTPPIYIPVPPPPDSGLSPEHPIYIPIPPPEAGTPPGIWGGGNEPFPTPPINIEPPDLTDEVKEKLKAFLLGNLPPFTPPDYVSPVS